MADLIGKLVVIEHSAMYDRHLIAKVIGQTKQTIHVVSWQGRQRDWSDEPKKRQTKAVKRIIGPVEDYSSFAIHQAHTQLMSLHDNLMAADKEARQTYWANLHKLVVFK